MPSGVVAAVCVPYERERLEGALASVRELVPDVRIVKRKGAHWFIGTVPRGTSRADIAGLLSAAGIAALSIVVSEEP